MSSGWLVVARRDLGHPQDQPGGGRPVRADERPPGDASEVAGLDLGVGLEADDWVQFRHACSR